MYSSVKPSSQESKNNELQHFLNKKIYKCLFFLRVLETSHDLVSMVWWSRTEPWRLSLFERINKHSIWFWMEHEQKTTNGKSILFASQWWKDFIFWGNSSFGCSNSLFTFQKVENNWKSWRIFRQLPTNFFFTQRICLSYASWWPFCFKIQVIIKLHSRRCAVIISAILLLSHDFSFTLTHSQLCAF